MSLQTKISWLFLNGSRHTVSPHCTQNINVEHCFVCLNRAWSICLCMYVCLSVCSMCWSRLSALQKRLIQWRCCLGEIVVDSRNHVEYLLVPHGKYDWVICAWQRCRPLLPLL